MPQYEFERGGRYIKYTVPMKEAGILTRRLEADGWRRVWHMPHTIIYPVSFSDAYEWALEDEKREMAEQARADKEWAREMAPAVREVLRNLDDGEEAEIIPAGIP